MEQQQQQRFWAWWWRCIGACHSSCCRNISCVREEDGLLSTLTLRLSHGLTFLSSIPQLSISTSSPPPPDVSIASHGGHHENMMSVKSEPMSPRPDIQQHGSHQHHQHHLNRPGSSHSLPGTTHHQLSPGHVGSGNGRCVVFLTLLAVTFCTRQSACHDRRQM